MPFRDLAEFQVVRPLVLPIRGKKYAFPGDISARGLLQLQRLEDQIAKIGAGVEIAAEDGMTNAELDALEGELFGDLKQQMIDDGCTSSQMKAVFWTLKHYHLSGIEAAEKFWNSLGEAEAPDREKPTTKAARPRGSHAGSKSAKTTSPPAPAGTTSSPTGS